MYMYTQILLDIQSVFIVYTIYLFTYYILYTYVYIHTGLITNINSENKHRILSG